MKNKKFFRPHKLCLAFLAVSVVILLAGQCFLRAGYPRSSISLNVQEGDIAQLQAFDLQGVWRQDEDTALAFSLRENTVTVSPQLHGQNSDGLPLWLQSTLCAPDEEIPLVDEQAESGSVSGYRGAFFLRFPYSGMQYTSFSDQLEMICTMYVTDGTDRSARFSLGTVQLAQPETVTAQLYDKIRAGNSHSYLVSSSWLQEENAALLPEVSIISSREQVCLYVGPHGEEPGSICLVREFVPEDQALQQISTVQVHGVNVPSLTQPYGAVEETCSFEAGEILADCQGWDNARLANGRQWLLTVDGENQVYLRILDSEGYPVARLPLDVTAEAEQTVTVLPTMRKDEAVFTVTDENGGKAVALRIEDDAVTISNIWDLAAGETLLTAGFSADGAQLMTVYENREELNGTVPLSVLEYYTNTAEIENRDCKAQLATGWHIQISAKQNLDEPLFVADLNFGIPQQGRENVWGKGIYETEFSPSFCQVVGVWQSNKEDAQ